MPSKRTDRGAAHPTRAARTPDTHPARLAARILANARHLNDQDRAAADVRAWLLTRSPSPAGGRHPVSPGAEQRPRPARP